MAKLTIDGKEVIVEEGKTILDACRQHGIRVPTLCHHPAVSSWGGCRMCVVEVDGNPRLAAACVMPVRDGMKVVTSNDNIITARRTILEFLFAERNHYCMICGASGDCELQALAYEYQMDHLTVVQNFDQFPVDVTNEYMAIDHNRCVLCGRCIRACHEISGAHVLGYQNRGTHNLVGFDLDDIRGESTCMGCGICMQLCPTGAILNRYRTHHAVKGHDKSKWKVIDSFCPQCGLLCPTVTSVENNNIIKIEGKTEPQPGRPDRGQLCQRGRFEPLKTWGKRLLKPMVRGTNGSWKEVTWKAAMDLVAAKINASKDGGTFGLASARCSNEELLLFRDLMVKGWNAGYVDTLHGPAYTSLTSAWTDLKKVVLGLKEASWKQLVDADRILLIGANPSESQPLISGLIRRGILERGVQVSVIGPVDVTAPWTTHYLPVASGKEPLLVKALLAEIMTSPHRPAHLKTWDKIGAEIGKVKVTDLLKQARLDEEGWEAFRWVVRWYTEAKNPMVVVGDNVTSLPDSTGLRQIMYMALLKDVLPENTLRLVVLKPNGNSAAALKMRIATEKSTVQKAATWKRGLVLLAGDDLATSPFLNHLGGLEFLAVISPYFPEELADKAHVLIPKPMWLEEEGTYASLDGYEIRAKKAVLTRPRGVDESWQTLLALMQRSEFHPTYARWRDLNAKAEEELRPGA
jgi:formate dehydrogenase major subunit